MQVYVNKLIKPSIKGTFVAILLSSITQLTNAQEYNANLDFKSVNQSMWTTGDAWQFNWRQDIEIINWEKTSRLNIYKAPNYAPDFKMLSEYWLSSKTSGMFGFSPYVNIDSGSVNVDYALDVNIAFPDANTVSPGETFVIDTSYNSLGTGVFTTNFPEIKAGVDLLMETQASLSLINNYCSIWVAVCITRATNEYSIFSLDIDPTNGIQADLLSLSIVDIAANEIYDQGRIPGLQFHNDQISLLGQQLIDIGDGIETAYGKIALNVPDIDTQGLESDGFVASGSDDLFYLKVDADKIALDIIEKAIAAAASGGSATGIDLPDLEGTTNLEPILGKAIADLIPIEISYNLLDIEPFLDVNLSQEFSFSPEELMVTFDLGNGIQTDPVKVGESLELIMPDSQFNIIPTFMLPSSRFSNLTELAIDFGVDLTLLDFGIDFQGILGLIPDINPDPLLEESYTVTKILELANLSSDFLKPDLFNNNFLFKVPEKSLAAFTIAPKGKWNDPDSTQVPEPSTWLLLSFGVFVIAWRQKEQDFKVS